MSVKAVHKLVQDYLKQGQMMVSTWKATVQDKSFPVDERWELFILAPVAWHETTTSSRPPIDSAIIGNRTGYDDFYIERGTTISAADMDAHILDWVAINEDEDDPEMISAAQHEAAREYMMQNMIGAWQYDW